MPTYVYETTDSAPRKTFEVRQGMADAPLTADPETGRPVRRVISGGIGVLTPGKRDSAARRPAGGGGHGCCGPACGCGR